MKHEIIDANFVKLLVKIFVNNFQVYTFIVIVIIITVNYLNVSPSSVFCFCCLERCC